VDDVVLRVIYNLESKGIPYFNKGQAMMVSYWDGSSWATQGGKYQIDFQENGPFKAYINSFHDLQACAVPSERDVTPCQNPATPFCWDTPSQLSSEQNATMQSYQQYCSYNYCTDYQRWKDTEIPPECQYQDQ
jgi:xyloglucan:xyloglucosyl transferase